MKKKLLGALSASLMMSLLLVGCSGSNDATTTKPEGETSEQTPTQEETTSTDEKQEVLKVAVFEGGYGKAFWEEVAKRFEADYPDVTVELTASPKIGDVIRPQLAAGNAPDFIYFASTNESGVAQALIKDKKLADLSDVFSQPAPGESTPIKDKMLPGFLDNKLTAPYGDVTVYLAPLYYNVTGLWYNSALFAEKGWEAPNTWDEFFALGDATASEGLSLFTYQGMYPGYNESIVWPAIAGAAGAEAVENIFSYADGAWEDENVVKALEIFQQIAEGDYLLKGTVAMNHTQAQTEHLKGSALFLPNGNWYEDEMKDAIQEGWEWGFMTSPVFNEGDTRYVATGIEEMYIPSDAANVELAKEFMRYLYKDEIVALNAELNHAVVPIEGAVEMAKEYVPASNYSSFKIFDESDVLPIMVGFEVATNTEINMKNEVFQPISSIMNKELTASDWAANLEVASDKVRESQE
ncbi:carbohydrate ABC transporter substrate-binding protein [Turicibacter sanguinis]|uniref:carbohydrate ABC transporter substrate-binding protein n=1 Tax=Turicibacter sanguinis TaxID=154288 RepID=UPI0012BC0838|nr:carbohydrate ABC transporter substrate-binding protein [Turicibacter sanguinis]MDB8437196.1 carbohydrate ABC transporter substrate-binding protein [Turicibacter sanguinis]MTO22681.1 carbohydrate ABC transporter substrate-binding protein [Turicibacter sanguinis]MTO25816.1 carbohydrate ABC transporter substrate-binding protein [Turicibacter sanguinis]MTO88722.1 carbohydrate ABC transporter substrate-binding protein [Turicibacter sanguinis]MTP68834.1 carbohydrate ABC transporter substrate-bind